MKSLYEKFTVYVEYKGDTVVLVNDGCDCRRESGPLSEYSGPSTFTNPIEPYPTPTQDLVDPQGRLVSTVGTYGFPVWRRFQRG